MVARSVNANLDQLNWFFRVAPSPRTADKPEQQTTNYEDVTTGYQCKFCTSQIKVQSQTFCKVECKKTFITFKILINTEVYNKICENFLYINGEILKFFFYLTSEVSEIGLTSQLFFNKVAPFSFFYKKTSMY